MDEDAQYNDLFEGLKESFRRLITLEADPGLFEQHYDGWKILFSSARENEEEEGTVRYLQMCAQEAGFETGFCYLDEVQFDEAEGIFDAAGENYEYWFKLYPWEDIALEADLPLVLNDIMKSQKAIILNPAYTLIFQSKGFMKILCDLFPDSPYLLKADFKPLAGIKQVEKKFFGREGANVTIRDADGTVVTQTQGEYANHNSLYQEYVELPKNGAGEYYQAGLFFAHEPVALGFRKGGLVMDNFAKFVGHRLI
jgi:glutathionylspermidine synthase